MEKKSAFGPSLMSGIYLGFALIAYSLVLFLLEIDRESPLQYISFAILAIGLFMSIISFRNKHMGGFIEYKVAFGAGFYAGLFASLLTAIYTFIYAQYIDPGMAQEILLQSEEQILEKYPNMSDEQIEQALSMTEIFTSPIIMAIMNLFVNLLISTVLSLLIAIFAKRENKEIA